MKTYNNLPKEYIVKCNTAEETTEVANFIKGCKKDWNYYKYVYNCKQYSPDLILWDRIFKDVEHLPVISFKEWKEVFLNEEEEFVLPEKWYCPYSNKEEFDVMNKFFGKKWGFIYPGGYRGCNNNLANNNWNPSWVPYGERITFEQFKKYVMKEFVLPEKYCVKHYQSVAEYIIKLEGSNRGNYFENLTLYSHFPQVKGLYCYSTPQPGYTEITIEEFNKYVLNKEEKEMKKETQVFKKGDVVEIIEVSKGSINTLRKGIIITEHPTEKGWYYVGYGYPNESTKEKRWEYADNLKQSAFTIGDIVVVIDNHTGSSNNIGDTGIITFSTSNLWVESCNGFTGGKYTNPKDIRFATDEEIKAFTPIYAEFIKPKDKTFIFDETTITVSKGKISLGSHGNITIKELENVINWVTNRPTISGYVIELFDVDNQYHVFNSKGLFKEYKIKFGCQQDDFNILIAVRDAYYELNQ